LASAVLMAAAISAVEKFLDSLRAQ